MTNEERPIYETPQQHGAEATVMEEVAAAWGKAYARLPRFSPVDYATVDNGKITAFIEVKCRRQTMAELDALGGILLSLQKWSTAARMCQMADVPFVLVARAADLTWYYMTRDFTHDGAVMGGRRDRNDSDDIEPVILLRASRFTLIKSLGSDA